MMIRLKVVVAVQRRASEEGSSGLVVRNFGGRERQPRCTRLEKGGRRSKNALAHTTGDGKIIRVVSEKTRFVVAVEY